MHIIIIGPPGCGKGTISKKIEKDYNIKHLSTGDLLRNKSECSETLKGGNFVSDEFITKLVHDNIDNYISDDQSDNKRDNKSNCCLLDGYPRTLNQTRDLKVKLVLLIKASDQVCIQRIQGRKDKREDDVNKEVIKKRLMIYHERTEPVIQFYKDQGLVEEIDGNGNVEEVYMNVKRILDNKI